jgi:cytochrome P450
VNSPHEILRKVHPGHVLTGFADCRAALAGPGFTSDPRSGGLTDKRPENLLLMSGQRHRLLRGLITPFFNQSAIARLTPRLQAVRDQHLHRLLQAGEGDLIRDFAEPLAATGIVEAVGIPENLQPRILSAVRGMTGLLEPDMDVSDQRRTMMASVRISQLLRREAQNGRAHGLYKHLIEARARGEITSAAVDVTLPVVLHGGYENPLNFLGALIANAAGNAEEFCAAARSSPEGAIEETLRLSPAARGVLRWKVGDRRSDPASRAEAVWIDLEAANRDAAFFESPLRPNYASPQEHLAFGFGSHHCPGTHLARLLGQLVLDGLLRIPDRALERAVVAQHVRTVARETTSAQISEIRGAQEPLPDALP